MPKNLYDLRIAKVLDDYRIVLNAGAEDGVSTGMVFVIYSPGEEIFDPVDGSSLGRLEETKGRVRVYHVQEKFCSASSDRKTTRRIGTKTIDSIATLINPQVGDLAKRVE